MPEPVKKRVTHHPLLELTIIRLMEFIRESDAVFWVFVFPLLLTVALGFAFREKPPERIPVGILEGPHAQARLAALRKSPALQPRLYSVDAGREELRRGKISLLIEEGTQPVYRYDPTRPEARGARLEVDDALQIAQGRRNAFAAKDVHASEQGSRYIDFLVPGLLGMNLMGTGMWSIGFATVNARLRKLLKRFVATPMSKVHYLVSQFLARLVFLILEVTAVMIFAWLVFGVTIRGSIFNFALVCLSGGIAFAALGILIASRARTIEAVSGLMNVVMMPMWICSGVFFSYERFPDAIKPIIRALPLTALTDALRAVMNDAAGIVALAPQLLNLLAWAVISSIVGLKIFRWQ
jgi:ABC-2 type transport system permease protein